MLLKLPDNLNVEQNWNNTLHRMLYESGLFDVQFVKPSSANKNDGYLPYPRMDGVRNSNWSTFELDGVLIGLDTWDTLHPTAGYEGLGYFNPDGYLKDVQIILKIQHHKYK
jgi:hypothetical protein